MANPLFESLTNQPALNLAQLRQLEATGLTAGLPLMQRAGKAAAQFVTQQTPTDAKILALVGPGNNGGDALVAARLLNQAGYNVNVVMPLQAKEQPKDAKQALDDWCLTDPAVASELAQQAYDLVIDGLFGIGLTRELGQPWQGIIDCVNDWSAPVLALDIPSGLDATTGVALGRPIKAQWTLAFIAPTPALKMQHCKPYTGTCFVANLGLAAAKSPSS